MRKTLSRFGLYTMILVALGVSFHAMRYAAVPFDFWIDIDNGIHGVIDRVPIQMLTHAIVAPIALLLGPFQFIPGFRSKRPRLHRYIGRIYVTACIAAGTAALATAPFASGGPVAAFGFGTLAVLWIGATVGAYRAAVTRRFELHRLLMRFSYAMTFAAVTLRLQIPLGLIFLGFTSYTQMSVWLAYTSWVPNVIVVGIYSIVTWTRQNSTPVTARA